MRFLNFLFFRVVLLGATMVGGREVLLLVLLHLLAFKGDLILVGNQLIWGSTGGEADEAEGKVHPKPFGLGTLPPALHHHCHCRHHRHRRCGHHHYRPCHQVLVQFSLEAGTQTRKALRLKLSHFAKKLPLKQHFSKNEEEKNILVNWITKRDKNDQCCSSPLQWICSLNRAVVSKKLMSDEWVYNFVP